MFYTYIIKSQKFDKYYIGYTNNLNDRLDTHNSGRSTYTKRYKPWKIIYYEIFNNRTKALSREKYFKSAAERKWLKKICRGGEIGRHASLRS